MDWAHQQAQQTQQSIRNKISWEFFESIMRTWNMSKIYISPFLIFNSYQNDLSYQNYRDFFVENICDTFRTTTADHTLTLKRFSVELWLVAAGALGSDPGEPQTVRWALCQPRVEQVLQPTYVFLSLWRLTRVLFVVSCIPDNCRRRGRRSQCKFFWQV